MTFTLRDREENFVNPTGSVFSPLPPASAPNQICWEANVVTFGYATTAPTSSAILGSTNGTYVAVPASWQNGWMNIAFAQTATTPSLTPVSSIGSAGAVAVAYYGLPVVGLMVQDFVNSTIVTGTGAAPGAAFGGNFNHKFTRDVR